MTQYPAIKVGVIVGSLRSASFSRKIALALIARAPEGLDCELVEIDDLPLYNEDLDADPPAAWTHFRDKIRACGALLFVTPEYNRSVPGCLKNATDVGSRPENESVFDGLPAAIVSVSPYALGGFGANHALRQSFVYLNLRVMQQPEAYVGMAADILDDQGAVSDGRSDEIFRAFMEAFGAWAAMTVDAASYFAAFLATREAASVAYINGDDGPLRAMSATCDPATFFPPSGAVVSGARAVLDANHQGAAGFGKGSAGSFEVLQSASEGRLAFWTGVQHADAVFRGKDGKQSISLRVTEVFRFEDTDWKLVHRHADGLKTDEL